MPDNNEEEMTSKKYVISVLFGISVAFAGSTAGAKVFSLDACTKSECETEEGVAAEATDLFYQSCSVDGSTEKPNSMSCHIRDAFGKWEQCAAGINDGDKMYCGRTNENIAKEKAKIKVKCSSD